MSYKNYAHVDVLILNFNGKSLLKRCLDSVLKTDYPDFEIFVIDNGSSDGSVEFVRKRYPGVKLVEIGRNIGVAAAYNKVIDGLSSEFVAVLNNDVEVDKDWLKKLMKVIDGGDNSIAAVTCKIRFLNNRKRINSAGGSCDRFGTGWNRGNGELDNGQYDRVDEPFYATETAMVMRKSLWEKTGRFDGRYFMYGEDLDRTWRARLLGYRVSYVPASVVYHKWQSSRGIVPILYSRSEIGYAQFFKNYSLKTLLLLILRYLMLKTLMAFWFLLRGEGNEKLAIPRAFVWNLFNLRKSLQKRRVIQSVREISDHEVQKKMFKGGFELYLWLGIVKHPI
ncbi:MAG: glycosyltransferase family 2 protein [Candidatus Freyarchaeota archaeon]